MEARRPREEAVCVEGASTADVLRLLGGGAAGAILLALGEGPLRTKELTERVPGYAPRTIYRHAGRLAELQVVEREEEPGVPSKVVHTLTDGCGEELCELVNRFADVAMARLPGGRIDARAWAALGLLADLWEPGLLDELACEPKSPTELARGPHGLSYHQVNRRAGLFRTAGLFDRWQGPGRRRCYALTAQARRATGLIASIARWRHRHVVGEGEEGMSGPEMAAALRAALPLARLPSHPGACFELCVLGGADGSGGEPETVRVEVGADGALRNCAAEGERVDAAARGPVEDWIPALLEGEPPEAASDDEAELVGALVDALYAALWSVAPA